MSQHLSQMDLERYHNRLMSPEELLNTSDHLATCDSCYQLLDGDSAVAAAYEFAQNNLLLRDSAYDHLEYEHMVAYLHEQLDKTELQRLSSHLASCDQCQQAIEDLRTAKNSLNLNIEYRPLTQSITDKKDNILTLPVNSNRLKIAALAAMIIIILLGYLIAAEIAALKQQLNQAQEIIKEKSEDIAKLQVEVDKLNIEKNALAKQLKSSLLDNNLSAGGKEIANSSNAQTIVSLNDGEHLIKLDSAGKLYGLVSLSIEEEKLIKQILLTGKIARPAILSQLIGKPSTLMGSNNDEDRFALIEPIATVLLNDQPTFRWQPLKDVTSYQLSIYDSNFNKVISSPSIVATDWTATRPLRRGKIYIWQVRAIKDNKEIIMPSPDMPQAKFKIVEEAKLAALNALKERYDNSHLMLGLFYVQNALLSQAEQEFQALYKDNPESILAKKLLNSLVDIRKASSSKSGKVDNKIR